MTDHNDRLRQSEREAARAEGYVAGLEAARKARRAAERKAKAETSRPDGPRRAGNAARSTPGESRLARGLAQTDPTRRNNR